MKHFLLFLFFLLLLAAVLQIDFFFSIVYFLVGVYLVLRIWARQVLQALEGSRDFQNRAFLEDSITVTVTLRNHSRWPIPWLMFNEAMPWVLAPAPNLREVISLGSLESYHFSYQLKAKKRGYYQLGPLTYNTSDILGLNRNLIARLPAEVLIVYPKILPLQELGLPTNSPQVVLATTTPIFEDPSRLMGVRPYAWGDNPRNIHWPATATTTKLMVKQFQPAIARDTVVFLNLSRNEYHRRERSAAVEIGVIVAASLAHHILQIEKQSFGFLAYGKDPLTNRTELFNLPPRKEEAHLMQVLEVLARIQGTESPDFIDQLRRHVINLSWGTTIVIITGTVDSELVAVLLWLKRLGFTPSLILVRSRGPRLKDLPAAIRVFEVWREKELSADLAQPL